MKSKVFVEVFPSVEQIGSCCDGSEGASSSDCCDTPSGEATSLLIEYSEFKRKIKDQYQQEVSVHIYDYSVPMDRALAKRKLNTLIRQRGFAHLQVDQVIEFATPAVVIDGQLVSFAQKIDYPLLDQTLKIK